MTKPPQRPVIMPDRSLSYVLAICACGCVSFMLMLTVLGVALGLFFGVVQWTLDLLTK